MLISCFSFRNLLLTAAPDSLQAERLQHDSFSGSKALSAATCFDVVDGLHIERLSIFSMLSKAGMLH